MKLAKLRRDLYRSILIEIWRKDTASTLFSLDCNPCRGVESVEHCDEGSVAAERPLELSHSNDSSMLTNIHGNLRSQLIENWVIENYKVLVDIRVVLNLT